MSHRAFVILIVVAAVAALGLRLPQLDLRPMHGDEAIHAVKFGALWRDGSYRYDPHEFHGPTLAYATVPAMWLTGARRYEGAVESTYRLVPVLFGVGLIPLLIPLAGGLGRAAAVCAATLTAISPAMVFYSRYYIQEMLLVFFSFALIVALWRCQRSAATGERSAQRGATVAALAAGASLGLMHATKETFVIVVAALLGAALLAAAWARWRDDPDPSTRNAQAQNAQPRKAQAPLDWRLLGGALLLGGVISALLFSGLGANPRGPLDSVLAFGAYLQRGAGQTEHVHPWNYYLSTLLFTRNAAGPWWSEGLIVALAAVGIAVSLGRRRRAESFRGPGEEPGGSEAASQTIVREETANLWLARFLSFYTLLLIVIYSALPYKTPWCLLGFLHGLILLAGIGAVAIVRRAPGPALKALAGLLLLGAAGQLAEQARAANFKPPFTYDRRNPYTYAQPVPDAVRLAERVEELSRLHPDGHRMPVQVIASGADYWPLPWYLRRFERAGYWSAVPREVVAPVVVVSPDLQPAVAAKLRAAGHRYQTEVAGLRPTVVLNVLIEKTLWDDFLRRRNAQNAQPAGGGANPQ